MKHVNFIPSDLRPKMEIPGVLIPAGLFLALVIYVSGSVVSSVIVSHAGQTELARIEAENAELTKKIDGLSGSKDRAKLEETMGGMKKILAKKNYWSGIFREMSVLMPEGVWLTGFTDRKDHGNRADTTSKGRANVSTKPEQNVLWIKGESSSQEMIAQFLISLEKSHHFSGVQLMFTEKESDVRPARFKFQFSVPITTAANGSG